MLGELRSVFWQTQCQCEEMDTHLQMKMSIGSVFVDLYEEMHQRLYQVDKIVQAKIVKDLKSSCQN